MLTGCDGAAQAVGRFRPVRCARAGRRGARRTRWFAMPMSTSHWSRRHVLGAAAAASRSRRALGQGTPPRRTSRSPARADCGRVKYFPRGAELTSITAIDITGRSDAELTLLATGRPGRAHFGDSASLPDLAGIGRSALARRPAHARGVKVRYATDAWKVVAGQHLDRSSVLGHLTRHCRSRPRQAGLLAAVAVRGIPCPGSDRARTPLGARRPRQKERRVVIRDLVPAHPALTSPSSRRTPSPLHTRSGHHGGRSRTTTATPPSGPA